MNIQSLSSEDVAMLRKRVEYEDQLLNSRTSIVLTLIIVVDGLWIVCSVDAQHYIHSLTARVHESGEAPIDEVVRRDVQRGRIRIGSTRFMSLIIPGLLLGIFGGDIRDDIRGT